MCGTLACVYSSSSGTGVTVCGLMHYVWDIFHLPSDTDAGGIKSGVVEPVEVGTVGPEEAKDCTAEATSVTTASLIVQRAAGVGSGGMALGRNSE